MINPRQTLAAALALPLIGLAASWSITHTKAQQGVDWEVPVQGYDPRDFLRGHFISYRYAWPGLKVQGAGDYAEALCIKGAAPNVATVNMLDGTAEDPACVSIARASPNSRIESQDLQSGILYIDQKKAGALQVQLSNPKLEGLVRIRIRADGQVRPLSIRFRNRANLPEPPHP